MIEGLPFDQLHGQKVDALLIGACRGFFNREDGDDVRVVDRGERFRLASEAVEPRAIACDVGRQHFDGHIAPQPRIARAIDLAHAAGAQQREDFVEAKASAGRKRQAADGS